MQDTGSGRAAKGEREVLLKRKPTQKVFKLEPRPDVFASLEVQVEAMDRMSMWGRWGISMWYQPKKEYFEITAITLASGFRIVDHFPKLHEGLR